MNGLSLSFENQPITMLTDDSGAPWWFADEVCAALSIADHKSSTRFLDEDEKGVHTVHTLGGTQQKTTINESGLYSLILRSRKPEAKRFKKWVTSEVLPSIRRTGSYSLAPMTAPLPATLDPKAMTELMETTVKSGMQDLWRGQRETARELSCILEERTRDLWRVVNALHTNINTQNGTMAECVDQLFAAMSCERNQTERTMGWFHAQVLERLRRSEERHSYEIDRLHNSILRMREKLSDVISETPNANIDLQGIEAEQRTAVAPLAQHAANEVVPHHELSAPPELSRPEWGQWEACARFIGQVLDQYPPGQRIYRADILRLLIPDPRQRRTLRVTAVAPVATVLLAQGRIEVRREWTNQRGHHCCEYVARPKQ